MPYLETDNSCTDRERLLGEALEEVLVAGGMLSAGNHLTGPQLLAAAADYAASLRSSTGIVDDLADDLTAKAITEHNSGQHAG